ncbi:MAG TPA: hypothetical protein VH988_24315 [Thermoanaerobaculia bacterium]|jgi:hypothetical protein|nr:hypothetical protein [Thermoanaerobaculia bacterium]
MGTSKGYEMPTGGEWTPLKRGATKYANDGGNGPVSPERLLRDYLAANGGARALSRGQGGGGGGHTSGGRGRGGRAARDVGRRLGGFLASVGSVGLDNALRDAGLAELIGRPAEEVSAGLLNALSDPANTLDEHAARLALAKLNDEMLRGAGSYEEVGRRLSEALDQRGLTNILASFFGHYLYERFCRDFYEDWVKKVGSASASRLLKSIKDCIHSSLKAKLIGRDVTRMNWRGREGLGLTEQVMRETLEIFEVLE